MKPTQNKNHKDNDYSFINDSPLDNINKKELLDDDICESTNELLNNDIEDESKELFENLTTKENKKTLGYEKHLKDNHESSKEVSKNSNKKISYDNNKNEYNKSGKEKVNSLKRLLKLAKPHLGKILLSVFFVILVNAAELLKPYILKLVIDDYLLKNISSSTIKSLVYMAILYFTVVLLGGVSQILQANLINNAAQSIMMDLRHKVFKTIQFLPEWYLDKTSSGRLITRATNDVESLSEMYTDVIINLFKDVFLLIGIVSAMLALNVKLALISFIFVPVIFFIVFLLKTKIKKNFSTMKSLIGHINGFMAENISGMKLIQIFKGEKEKKEEFLDLNKKYLKSTLFQVRLNSILRPAAEVFQSLSIALILWYSMGKIENGTLEIGVLYAFTNYIKQFFNPIADLAENYTTIQSALVSADRIFELLDEKPNLEDLDNGLPLPSVNGTIEFKNVWFAYNDEDWVLKDVSFKINAGETAAFVGETGAGKTTIISLIAGFYPIQKGEILLDGINIVDIKKRDLRHHMAIVLQDVFLFSGNIRNNITLKDTIDDEKVINALKDSCALEFVNKLDGGLNAIVRENGNSFSAGERQLLSFARALAHDPSIFILDEATSNIDTHTEKLIQQVIDKTAQDRTTIVIAHRLSTIKKAHKIIVLKHGQILEQGNHNQLVELDGYYNALLKQSSGNALYE